MSRVDRVDLVDVDARRVFGSPNPEFSSPFDGIVYPAHTALKLRTEQGHRH